MSKLLIVALRERVFSGQNEVAIDAVLKLVDLHIELIKERLLRAKPEEVPPLQGEAYAFASVRKWIKEPLLKAAVDNQ